MFKKLCDRAHEEEVSVFVSRVRTITNHNGALQSLLKAYISRMSQPQDLDPTNLADVRDTLGALKTKAEELSEVLKSLEESLSKQTDRPQ